jgi:hypothetical protein
MDGQTDYFNPTELQIIEDAWEHASEDFAPFATNVTTVAPSAMVDGVNQRIAIGGRWEDWYKTPSSGVAYVGAFTNPSYPNIGYMFSQSIFEVALAGDDVAAKIGSTISHEAGHAFGLEHKGDVDAKGVLIDSTDEYSEGGADWTPIMGNNLNLDRTIWVEPRVEITPGSVWAEGSDDVKVLTSALGARSDDHSDAISTATPLGTLSAANPSKVDTGIIERKADIDTFTFSVSAAGTLTIQLLVNDVGANLDSRIGFGPVSYTAAYLAESNPNDGSLNATITSNVQPGDFYVDVASVRRFIGDIGQYTLRVDLAVPSFVLATPIAIYPVMITATYDSSRSENKGSGGDSEAEKTQTTKTASYLAQGVTESETRRPRPAEPAGSKPSHRDDAGGLRQRLLALDAVFASLAQ